MSLVKFLQRLRFMCIFFRETHKHFLSNNIRPHGYMEPTKTISKRENLSLKWSNTSSCSLLVMHIQKLTRNSCIYNTTHPIICTYLCKVSPENLLLFWSNVAIQQPSPNHNQHPPVPGHHPWPTRQLPAPRPTTPTRHPPRDVTAPI